MAADSPEASSVTLPAPVRRTRGAVAIGRAVDRRPDLALTWVEATPA